MVRWPAPERMSKVSLAIVERFKKTAAAKDLEQDAREWALVNWPWMPDAPYKIVVRAGVEEQREFVCEADGLWRMKELDPLTPTRAA